MGSGHEYSLARDTIHVDAGGALDVVQMDVAVFRYEIDDVVLGGNLHRHRKIVLRFRWEENVHGFFGKRLVAGGTLTNLETNRNYVNPQ